MLPLNRILYVEDDPDIQMVARLALAMVGGFTVEICSGAEEALGKVEGFAPDLILLDVMMPVMDGPTTLAELRKIPAVAGIPVIFMTAKVQSHEIDYYKQIGAIDVISKPFDPMSLATTLRDKWKKYHESFT